MKKYLMLIMTILIVATAVAVPKQEVHAMSFAGKWCRNLIFNMAADKVKEKTQKKIKGEDEKENAPQISSSVSETEKKGTGMNNTNLSDETMTPTVTYTAFQDSVSQFISIIVVVGGFYLGVSILRSLGMFMISIAQFAMTPTYPRARYMLLKNLLVSVVCIALLGSVGLLTQLIAGVVFHA